MRKLTKNSNNLIQSEMEIILKKPLWFTVITTLCLVVITLFAAIGCDKTEILPKHYTINFVGEEVDIEPQSVTQGNYATAPENPEREGYDFGGWFSDNGIFSNEWDFKTDIVTQDTTLYAKWEENILQETNLQGTKWKLVGIGSLDKIALQELEPKDCAECYTLAFDTDDTFSGRLADNVTFGYYEIDYNTGVLHFTEIAVSEMLSIWEEYEILYWQILKEIRSFTVEDTYPKILYLYYNDGKNYLKFKK